MSDQPTDNFYCPRAIAGNALACLAHYRRMLIDLEHGDRRRAMIPGVDLAAAGLTEALASTSLGAMTPHSTLLAELLESVGAHLGDIRVSTTPNESAVRCACSLLSESAVAVGRPVHDIDSLPERPLCDVVRYVVDGDSEVHEVRSSLVPPPHAVVILPNGKRARRNGQPDICFVAERVIAVHVTVERGLV